MKPMQLQLNEQKGEEKVMSEVTMQAVYIMYFNTLVFIMSEMISHSRVLSRGVR